MIAEIEKKKERYIELLYKEMMRRGFKKDEITKVIAKTPFMETFDEFPEEQLHYAVESAADEIMLSACLK
ncbi:MAG: hypothetical protein K6E53_05270 [Lachnospiraceae bacterium]|nr:hypothetical protein [Lachnospiraceae bacterium]